MSSAFDLHNVSIKLQHKSSEKLELGEKNAKRSLTQNFITKKFKEKGQRTVYRYFYLIKL
jgi:hypothetical protein